MQRLFLLALAFLVALGAAIGVYLYVSLIPFFHEIGLAASGLLILCIICAASLVVTFCYTRIRMMLSRMRQSQLLSRVVAVGEVVAVPNGDGTWTHLSAMHEAAKIPRMLPAPKDEVLVANDQTVIDLYKSGRTLEGIMDDTKLKYNRVQRVVAEAKKRGEIPA